MAVVDTPDHFSMLIHHTDLYDRGSQSQTLVPYLYDYSLVDLVGTPQLSSGLKSLPIVPSVAPIAEASECGTLKLDHTGSGSDCTGPGSGNENLWPDHTLSGPSHSTHACPHRS